MWGDEYVVCSARDSRRHVIEQRYFVRTQRVASGAKGARPVRATSGSKGGRPMRGSTRTAMRARRVNCVYGRIALRPYTRFGVFEN